MFVRPDWTRRGLGRRILEECERAARREGFRRLSLAVTLAGLPLYLAYGFQPLEDVEVTMPDGVTVAAVSMEKPIAAGNLP
jgi:GNAT superfamily N-acetyltransferase